MPDLTSIYPCFLSPLRVMTASHFLSVFCSEMFLLEPTLSALHFFEFLLTLVRVMHALSHPFLFICILLLCTGARRASELTLLSSPAACTVHPVPLCMFMQNYFLSYLGQHPRLSSSSA